MVAATCASVLVAACAGDPEAVWYRFTPMVVPESYASDVVFEVRLAGAPVEARLDLASGPVVLVLADDGSGVDATSGDGVHTVAVPAADILFGFAPDDVGRNFVGYLRLFDGATEVAQYNVFVDVLVPSTPPVTVTPVSPTVQRSEHLVNMVDPGFYATGDLESVAQDFYLHFGDNYEFLSFVWEIGHFRNRNHIPLNNQVHNIGVGIGSPALSWGSAGRLVGRSEFPIPTMFDAAGPAYLHELGHQWVNFLPITPIDAAIPHWPLSDLAAGIMGWGRGPNTQGLDFSFDLVASGPDYALVPSTSPKVYTDLSRYLMGLVPPAAVGSHFVFDDQTQTPMSGGLLLGPTTTVTISDVTSSLGLRIPNHTMSPKRFRVATVLVSRDGLVGPEAMRQYDHFAARGEIETLVDFSDGFLKGQANPFHLATGNQGRLDMRIVHRILVDASRDGGLWWFPQGGPFDPLAPHQGRALADHLRSTGYRVDELPRGASIDGEDLEGYDLVIRAGAMAPYDTAEIAAYTTYVSAGGDLLLLSDHMLYAPPDDLAAAFGIAFTGITRGANTLGSYAAHPITAGQGPLAYMFGSAVTGWPSTATILGALSGTSFLDANGDGVHNPGEVTAPDVLGLLEHGEGQILFGGDVNMWQSVPQPLLGNALLWLETH